MKPYDPERVAALIAAAEDVGRNWESGDLAGAVDELLNAAHDVKSTAKRIRKPKK